MNSECSLAGTFRYHTLLALSCLLLLTVAHRNEAGAQPKKGTAKTTIADNKFIFGINLPWFDGQYDHDLGPNALHPNWKVWYDGAKVSKYYEDIHSIGFRVVRVWLMEGAEGLIFDSDGIITGLDETFLKNLDDLVTRAKAANLRLYPCLTEWKAIKKFPSPVRDERQQKAYLEKAVQPLAKRLKDNTTIFAIDIYNEIEAELRDDAPQKVTIKQAQDFIRNNAQAIKKQDPKRLVSSGSGYHGWKIVQDGFYKNLGLDFYDIHVYSDDGTLPDVRELKVDKPVIVGEFGQGTRKEDDALQQKVVPLFMRSALTKGYAGCFVWAYGPERFFSLTRDKGQHRPVVADIQKIINANPKSADKVNSADDLKKKLVGTKWINSNKVSFEWTADGRFLHKGVEREWKVVDGKSVQITFGKDHVDTLVFNETLTTFKQQIKGGPDSLEGKRSDK